MLMMKLKQRVLFISSIGIFLLLVVKLKLKRDEIYFESAKRSISQLSDDYTNLADPNKLRHSNPIEEFLTKKDKLPINLPNVLDALAPEQTHPWLLWQSMVQSNLLTSPANWKGVISILHELSNARVIKADVGVKGTQLKLSLHLDGPIQQQVVYKPMRYPRDYLINGSAYDGYDRHNGEIAAFHLDFILGFNRAPPVVGRMVDLEREIKPFADSKLLKTFSNNDNGDSCFYGSCYFCRPKYRACGNGPKLEGSITIWLPPGWELMKTRHPYQRTYKAGKQARWETTDRYCDEVKTQRLHRRGRRFLDIMDTAIFDFLIGNADRHHYETFKKDGDNGMLLHLDNAKSFGNPYRDELSILAPITQCCRLRKATYERLLSFGKKGKQSLSSLLQSSMSIDPIKPILTNQHLAAIDRRLRIALNHVSNCISEYGQEEVLRM